MRNGEQADAHHGNNHSDEAYMFYLLISIVSVMHVTVSLAAKIACDPVGLLKTFPESMII